MGQHKHTASVRVRLSNLAPAWARVEGLSLTATAVDGDVGVVALLERRPERHSVRFSKGPSVHRDTWTENTHGVSIVNGSAAKADAASEARAVTKSESCMMSSVWCLVVERGR